MWFPESCLVPLVSVPRKLPYKPLGGEGTAESRRMTNDRTVESVGKYQLNQIVWTGEGTSMKSWALMDLPNKDTVRVLMLLIIT